MKISGEQVLSGSREQVWELFNDPNRLARLVPGVQKLEILGPDEFAGTVNIGVAAVKGVYSGKIKIEDKRPPEFYKVLVDGKGAQGFMRGSGTIELQATAPNQTLVRYSGDVQVGGPVMQVGQRMLESVAKMTFGQFFAAADAELKASAKGVVARQGVFINFWRYLVRLVRGWFARG
jgi:carbon monoxide dehydrogenase subunit G